MVGKILNHGFILCAHPLCSVHKPSSGFCDSLVSRSFCFGAGGKFAGAFFNAGRHVKGLLVTQIDRDAP